MRCKNCNEYFQIKRDLFHLFDTEELYLCPKCLNRYPINIKEMVIPLNKGYKLFIYQAYDESIKINYDAFSTEIEKIYNKLKEKHRLVLMIDKLEIEDDDIKTLEELAESFNTDIAILTYQLSNL